MKIPTLMEERVMQLPYVYVPSGKSEVTWKMNPNDLVVMFAHLGVPCSIAPLVDSCSSTFVTKVPEITSKTSSDRDATNV